MQTKYAVLLVLLGLLSAGCHRATPRAASSPLTSPRWEHCWWAAHRTALPPDSVAARFARAYDSLGLSNAGWSHQADTAWAEAGPTTIAREGGSGINEEPDDTLPLWRRRPTR